SSGSSWPESCVEPTKSQNITVSCRRSASGALCANAEVMTGTASSLGDATSSTGRDDTRRPALGSVRAAVGGPLGEAAADGGGQAWGGGGQCHGRGGRGARGGDCLRWVRPRPDEPLATLLTSQMAEAQLVPHHVQARLVYAKDIAQGTVGDTLLALEQRHYR